MKKIFLISGILLLGIGLSACTNSDPVDTTEPVVTPVELNLNNNVASSPSNTKNNMITLENQEDLLKEYSQAIIKTTLGDIKVSFYNTASPKTVNNFLNLAKSGFYNETKFHRVIKDFMIQGGDPNSKGDNLNTYGTGGPGYKFADEINNNQLVAGSLAMANAGPNTNGSQFFIVTAAATPWLDGLHTNFGEIISGMDIVKKIEGVATGQNDIPLEPVVINSIELLK